MKKKVSFILLSVFLLLLGRERSFAQQEVKGPFVLKDRLLKAHDETFVLREDVKVVTSAGQSLSVESLPFARLIKVYKDTQGRVREIVILGWED